MKRTTLLLLLPAFFPGLSTDLPAQTVQPKIDVHMHARTSAVRTPDGNPMPIPCMPDGCEPDATIVKNDADVMVLAIESMKRNNIVLGIVTDANLDRVYEWVAADPDRFWAGPAVFNPVGVDIASLRAEFEAGRLQVMGEIAAQYQGFAPNDPALEPFFGLAEALDVPTLIHCEGVAGASSAGICGSLNNHLGHTSEGILALPPGADGCRSWEASDVGIGPNELAGHYRSGSESHRRSTVSLGS